MKSREQQILITLARVRRDYQLMRIAVDNRIGVKANGEPQNIDDGRYMPEEDLAKFEMLSEETRKNETKVEKMLLDVLGRFPIWVTWLSCVKGIGSVTGAWLLGSIDIHHANTVSKIWQYAGLNPSMVYGKKRIAITQYEPDMGEIVRTIMKDGKPKDYIVRTNNLVRGDRPTPGYILPYNKELRIHLMGIMATNFIRLKSDYAQYYYNMKNRLEHDQRPIESPGTRDHGKLWSEVSKGHRDMAAKRYMVKMFLLDLYKNWRALEGLEVRQPYVEQYLGHQHVAML